MPSRCVYMEGLVGQYKCSYDELLDIHKLVPNPKNPNKHSQDQIERLAKIIDYQGQRQPIVVSKQSGFIVTGHGRLEAMRALGWDQVAVNYQDFDTPAQEYAHVVADNAIAEWSKLDLKMVNIDFLEHGPELDLEYLGLEDFVVEPLEHELDQDKIDEITDDLNKKWILEIQLPNEMELADIRDDLMSRGYLVKEK